VTSGARRTLITLALVGVAVVWGGTFVMVKDAVAGYPLYSFLGWRFAVATVAFVVLFPGSLKRVTWGTVRIGLLAGAFLTAGYIFQTWGLQATSASKAAFVTGMFVVITPLMQAVLLRRPPKAWTIAGGVLLCAVAYSAHMIVLGGPGRRYSVTALTLVQLATVAIATGAVALLTEHAPLPTEGSLVVALLTTGVLASAVAFAVQTYAQQLISPTKTALILITEPVFGGVFGWLAGESLGVSGLAGSALILGGMIFAEVVGTSAAARPSTSSSRRRSRARPCRSLTVTAPSTAPDSPRGAVVRDLTVAEWLLYYRLLREQHPDVGP
jgi:drug/metabolite transporter (DMT)-like permease